MFWHTLFSTFALVFLAELGDKTQLATILLAAQGKPVWGVFWGAALALILSSVIGVLLGSAITHYLPPQYLQKGAAIAFIILGFLLLAGKF